MNRFSVSFRQVIEPVHDQCVEAGQARIDTQNCVVASSASCFQVRVFPHFCEREFDVPVTDECLDDAFGTRANRRAEEVFVPVTVGQITQVKQRNDELKNGLSMGCLSGHRFKAKFWRLLLHVAAYNLLNAFRDSPEAMLKSCCEFQLDRRGNVVDYETVNDGCCDNGCAWNRHE